MLNVFIKDNQIYSKPIEYVLNVFAKNISRHLALTKNKAEAHLIFDHSDPQSISVNLPFFELLLTKQMIDLRIHFKEQPYVVFPESKSPDWLGTAFYLINCFQEHDSHDGPDSNSNYGRFRFTDSYQYRFNCIDRNVVQECFDQFFNAHLAKIGFTKVNRPTTVFLSHDIDMIHGSFVQDGLWAIRKGRLDILFRLVANEILQRPHWRNIDQIVKLHDDRNLKSTFFWLATQKVGVNNIKNADYDIRKVTTLVSLTRSNGLHKSCYSTSFTEELKTLPFHTKLNRYHFLKFTLPSAWHDLETAGLGMDASLGFAEHYGFRNSYGLPFCPYNLDTQSPYHLVEVPLHVMDATLHRYMKIPISETARHVIDFIEKHRDNAIISILWHNTYFTRYKYSGYLQEYLKILSYLSETGIRSTTPEDILNTFAHGK